MAASSTSSFPTLEHIANPSTYKFVTPAKRINDGTDLDFFFVSKAYRDLTKWLLQLNRAIFPTRGDDDKQPEEHRLDKLPTLSVNIQHLQALLRDLAALIEQAPPHTGPRRFGNVAFRTWYKLADEKATDLVRNFLEQAKSTSASGTVHASDALVDELKAYLVGGFGSSQRLDYGTGHELSFLAFLGGLWKLGFFEVGEERAIVLGLIQPYLELIRKLILTYTLEPAGSHGVWGLDDHSFLPYIFGSAQLGPPISANEPVPTEGSLPSAPSPSSVTNKTTVAEFKDSNMYFSAIQFIYDVKKGPFWEHSPVLYDISGIKDGWGKINKGMLKMYAAEVLGKFPVVQHFPFGSLFEWERDPSAAQQPSSVHTQQQPTAMQSKDVPPVMTSGTAAPWAKPGTSSGTAAPWAKPGGTTMPQMQASTGMPTMRAPWSGSTASGRTTLPPSSDAYSQRQNQQRGMPPIAAPWARRDPPT